MALVRLKNWRKVMTEELSKESLEKMIKEVRDMVAAREKPTGKPTGKPTKVLIQPALLAQRGYTVEDVSKMVRENTNERTI
jgi:SOS response regulatory protein OraA/RecX